jgi:hypothetical protein
MAKVERGETVWKPWIGSVSWSHEPRLGGEKAPSRTFWTTKKHSI